MFGFAGGLNPFYFVLETRVPKQIMNACTELSLSAAYLVCVAAPIIKDMEGQKPLFAMLAIGIVPLIVTLSIKPPA